MRLREFTEYVGVGSLLAGRQGVFKRTSRITDKDGPRLVIVEGISPVLVGIAAGTIAALTSARVIRTLVFGVSASDPGTLAAWGPRWLLLR